MLWRERCRRANRTNEERDGGLVQIIFRNLSHARRVEFGVDASGDDGAQQLCRPAVSSVGCVGVHIDTYIVMSNLFDARLPSGFQVNTV